jgi:uncharacterized protein (TIGR03118 family)
MTQTSKFSIRFAAVLAAVALSTTAIAATNFVQHNLVADTAGVADNTDPYLIGAWGISASPTSPFWISNTGNGTSTLYNTAGVPNQLVVTVPASAYAPQGTIGSPTGQVWNGYGAGNFEIVTGRPASFLFCTLDGTISGFNGALSPNVSVLVDNYRAGAVYTGLGIGISSAGPTLYAANFALGTIDTFDRNFYPVPLPGGFIDPQLPSGFSPTNIQRFGHLLYVTYAQSTASGRFVYGPGSGLINVFDLDGNLVQHLLTTSANLNIPWGLAIAGANFGSFSYSLIVGNFGDGTVSAYDQVTGAYLGSMMDGKGNYLSIDGLWGLQFGSQGSLGNANGGDATALYFAAAPGSGSHGLFGYLRPASDSIVP